MSVVVHINSWPGAGKLTIARHMAQLMGARVVDNHTLMNPALALFDRDDPNFAPARAAIRGAVLEQALLGAPNVPLIFTNALGQSAHDREVFTQIEAFAMKRGATLVNIVLTLNEAENISRLCQAGRGEQRKLGDPEILRGLRQSEILLGLDQTDAVVLDVTDLSANRAAQILASKVAGIGGV